MAGREHSSGGGSVSRSGTCGYGGAPTEGSGGSAFGIHVQSYREDANSAPALARGAVGPGTRRALPGGLVDTLAAHYGSPGRLADYR